MVVGYWWERPQAEFDGDNSPEGRLKLASSPSPLESLKSSG